MKRAIVGFHQDDEQHWVADLACGHTQHLRHVPPFTERPWVTTEEGRREKLGVELDCVDCDGGERPEVHPADTYGRPPRNPMSRMISELHVNDLQASLSFWRDILGFQIAFQRPEERFVFLEHAEGQQIMLCQRHGRFETGPLEAPLGQGAMFQIYLTGIAPILDRLSARNWPPYLGPREIWRRVGDEEHGQREVFVQDPDGYLLMLAEPIGQRVV